MTDLEMTKLAAQATDYKLVYPDDQTLPVCIESIRGAGRYDPLHDDKQAMALVKKFGLMIDTMADRCLGWMVCDPDASEDDRTVDVDLNRAIVRCVAHMQERK